MSARESPNAVTVTDTPIILLNGSAIRSKYGRKARRRRLRRGFHAALFGVNPGRLDLDGPQAGRRDDVLRARRRGARTRDSGIDPARGARRDRSGSPRDRDARRAWQPRGSEREL